MTNLLDQAYEIYQISGQSGVFEWALRNNVETWAWCEPCEYNSPISDNTCLVCWTTREDN